MTSERRKKIDFWKITRSTWKDTNSPKFSKIWPLCRTHRSIKFSGQFPNFGTCVQIIACAANFLVPLTCCYTWPNFKLYNWLTTIPFAVPGLFTLIPQLVTWAIARLSNTRWSVSQIFYRLELFIMLMKPFLLCSRYRFAFCTIPIQWKFQYKRGWYTHISFAAITLKTLLSTWNSNHRCCVYCLLNLNEFEHNGFWHWCMQRPLTANTSNKSTIQQLEPHYFYH